MAALIPLLDENEAERNRSTHLTPHSWKVEELGFEPRLQELQGSPFRIAQLPVAFVFHVKCFSFPFLSYLLAFREKKKKIKINK